MFFSGRLPKPPWETRSRVEALVKQFDRAYIQNYGDRFRFSTLQSRFAAFIDLWDRGLRAREEGRPGPFAQKPRSRKEPEKKKPEDRILHVAAFQRSGARDRQADRALRVAGRSAARGRRGATVPFHKFAELVKGQVKKLRQTGSPRWRFAWR